MVWTSVVLKYVSCSAHSIPYLERMQNFSAPIGATSGPYVYTDTSVNQHQPFTFADGGVYPTLLELTTPYTDWACGAASTESCLASAGATVPLPMSQDTGAVRSSFGPPPLPIPLTLQHHTPSALHEIPTAHWGTGYAEAANGAAMFGGAPQDLNAAFADALPMGYDVAAAQVGLDEFIKPL